MTTNCQGLWKMDIDEEHQFSNFIPQVKHDLYSAGWVNLYFLKISNP